MELVLENCKSKSGKHAIATRLYKYEGDKFVEVKEYKILEKLRPTYTVGEAVKVDVPSSGIYIMLRFVRNIKGRYFGRIIVYENGVASTEIKYRKLKLFTVYGYKKHVELVKRLMDELKITVKRVNVGNAV